jgi:hypothetical protein
VRALALALALALAGAGLALPVRPEGLRERFTDPEDGAFDASEYLLDHRGVLPVPIIITEPAVGYGGGISLAWFSESIRDAAARAQPGGHITPPNILGVALAGTENGTKFGGVGGRASFEQDTWRYRGGLAAMDVNLDFYGIGANLPKIGYNLKGGATFQELTRRVADSDHFLGLRWQYMDLDSSLQPGDTNLTPKEFAHRSSQVGATWVFDSRDNIFFSSRGMEAALEGMFASPSVGSDNTFQTYRAHVFGYLPVDKFVVALRADARTARGDVPFYQIPFIDMRGVPAGRYQDEKTALMEVEGRWYVTPRWVALAFVGAGRDWGRSTSFSEAGSVVSKGVGFRYVAARRLGLAIGIDVAKGPEKTAWYLQVGNAWR